MANCSTRYESMMIEEERFHGANKIKQVHLDGERSLLDFVCKHQAALTYSGNIQPTQPTEKPANYAEWVYKHLECFEKVQTLLLMEKLLNNKQDDPRLPIVSKLIGALTKMKETITGFKGDYRLWLPKRREAIQELKHTWIRKLHDAQKTIDNTKIGASVVSLVASGVVLCCMFGPVGFIVCVVGTVGGAVVGIAAKGYQHYKQYKHKKFEQEVAETVNNIISSDNKLGKVVATHFSNFKYLSKEIDELLVELGQVQNNFKVKTANVDVPSHETKTAPVNMVCTTSAAALTLALRGLCYTDDFVNGVMELSNVSLNVAGKTVGVALIAVSAAFDIKDIGQAFYSKWHGSKSKLCLQVSQIVELMQDEENCMTDLYNKLGGDSDAAAA